MGLNKVIAIIGLTILVLQSTNSASIGARDKACICTCEYFPVCGSDGITYGNTCEFECEKEGKIDLDINFYGECEDELKPVVEDLLADSDCACTFIYEPICGSNRITYSSECEFNCAKKYNQDLEVFSTGECVTIETLPVDRIEKMSDIPDVQTLPVEQVEKMQEIELCACAFIYQPVCGSDGQTYSSECELNCAKKYNNELEVFSMGDCIKIETLPVEQVEKMSDIPEVQTLPVEQVEKIQLGRLCICTQILMPVCGTDGKTYSNKCILECAKRDNKDLEVASMGPCSMIETLPVERVEKMSDIPEVQTLPVEQVEKVQAKHRFCPLIWGPVCGTDGKTYGNRCFFKYAKESNKSLEIKHIGVC